RQFDISLPKDKIIDVFRFKCQNNNEYFGKGAFLVEQSDSKGVWFTLIGKQMALRWYDNTIIMLDRLPDRKSINPSFSCSGKLNLTEKAICESDELSGYDKSVDAQYKICARYAQTGVAKNTEMVAYNKKYITGLRSTQKRWIIKRNECGSNIECIKSALLARLSFLQEIDITDPISAFEPEE
ncbi:MAG: hypothetical protein LBG78_07550, partial [Azoarcus sp.]|nr:hypothetical protein [Azoarcus sp.]